MDYRKKVFFTTNAIVCSYIVVLVLKQKIKCYKSTEVAVSR